MAKEKEKQSEKEPKKELFKVNLSHRRPLLVDKEEWPVLLSAKFCDGKWDNDELVEGTTWEVTVRTRDCGWRGRDTLAYGHSIQTEYGESSRGARQGIYCKVLDNTTEEEILARLCDLLQVPNHCRVHVFNKLDADTVIH
jgi:hypothetical protein